MAENERNTKFLGFAQLLQDELAEHTKNTFLEQVDTVRFMREQRTIIAQRAYDFAYHTLYETSQGMDRVFGIPYKLEQVPDLTEWPPTSTEP